MDTTNIGGKIMYIIATILAAVGITTGVALSKDQEPSVSPQPETVVPQQEANETETEPKTENENKNPEQGASSVYTLEDGVVIEITPAVTNGKISGPVSIQGSVPSSASKSRFTIRVIDPAGKSIVKSSVSASSSGSDSNSAKFSTNLNFNTSEGGTGSLQITRDGSGDTITIPVEF